jgi:hypothetical protein
MKYNPSLSALSFPEKIPPLFDPSRVYNRDTIAVESARLAYFKFEKDPQSRQIIESALAIVGFDHVEYFSGHVHGGQAVAAWQIAGNDALIAFRGTQPDNLTDIVTDLQIPRSAWPPCARRGCSPAPCLRSGRRASATPHLPRCSMAWRSSGSSGAAMS